MLRYVQARGTAVLAGECLIQNEGMAALARSMGFTVTPSGDGETMSLVLELKTRH